MRNSRYALPMIAALLMLCAGFSSARAQAVTSDGDHLRVALITAAPGAIYWERFGHNAILIEDTVSGDSRMYNFGWFDFEQENFILNFVRGRMLYLLADTDPAHDLAGYRAEGRSVWMQELNLDNAQKLALAQKLAHNALPENAEYRYDYYRDNCSTRVRDVLDEVIGGALQQQSVGRGRGETYRSLSLAYARPISWLALGIHLGLGPAADRRINFWEEAFLPLRLRDLVNELQIADGAGNTRPLVSAQRTLFAAPLDDHIPEQPRWFWRFLMLGITLSALVILGLSNRNRLLRTAAAAVSAIGALMIGLIGLGLIGLWLGTDHEIAWRNANIGLFNPLYLVLALPLWRLRNPQSFTRTAARSIGIVALIGGLALLASALLKLNGQAQADWMALMLPWQLLICWLLSNNSPHKAASLNP